MRNQTRRSFLAGLGAGLLPAETKKPNIVLVLFDDLGWKDFGCYGSSMQATPHIDALAREGMRFTNAYAACPVCSPSRAALLTGRYPVRSGVTDWIAGRPQWPTARVITPRTRTYLPLEEVTLPELLKPAGYQSASIGKWHLGGTGFLPTDQGFDHNTGGNQRGGTGYFGPFDMPGLEGRTRESYITTELGEAARRFAREANPPFLIYAPNYAVHIPLEAPGMKNQPGTYREMLRIADDEIGKLRREIAGRGEEQNTIWIVTSDNGGLLHEGASRVAVTENRPLRAGKGHLYEGGIRVPLIIKGPGLPKGGTECSQRVCGIDLLPTLLEWTGRKIPSNLDGVSLMPALAGRRIRPRPLFWHYPHYSNQGGMPGSAVIDGDWKWIRFHADQRQELFHLGKDPGEQRNLIEAEPKQAARLASLMDQWIAETKAVLPEPNPRFDPAKEDQGLYGAERPTAVWRRR